jgi:hypothetical protein
VGANVDLDIAGTVLEAADRFEGFILGIDVAMGGGGYIGARNTEAVVESLEFGASVIAVEEVVLGHKTASNNVIWGGGVGGSGGSRDYGKLEAYQKDGGDSREGAGNPFLLKAPRVKHQLTNGTGR